MNLYWKISLWFWLSMFFMLVTGAVIFTLTIKPGSFIAERTALFNDLDTYALAIDRVGKFNHTPLDVLNIVISSIPFSSEKSQLVLVKKDTSEVIKVPQHHDYFESDSIHALLNEHHPNIQLKHGLVTIGPMSVTLFPDKQYQLFLVKRHSEVVFSRLIHVTERNPLYLLMAVLASVLFCFAITRYLRTSLRRLQVTVQKIASGDLSARVCETLSYQRDEIGKLSASVNFMADCLETLIQQKQRLMSDVSHELRSPLTRLKISNALAYKKAGYVAKAEFERIELEINRIDKLIGHIIQWSKLSSELFVSDSRQFDLNTLIEKVVEDTDFEASSMDKNVSFIRAHNVQIVASYDGLSSAIENIIRNAIRFTPEGSTVEVALCCADMQVEITIRDYGLGVPEESISMLFEPFYRVDETRGGDNSGSGLGMAISQAVIANHNGTITACNMHPGLQVIITLPV